MCAVSAVGDDWQRRLTPWKDILPDPSIHRPVSIPENGTNFRLGQLEKQMRELRELVNQMKTDLEAAKAQDVADGNPSCEMEEKVALIKRIAEAVGVDLSEVFSK